MIAAYTYRTTIDLSQKQRELIWDTIANVGDKLAHQFALRFIGPDGSAVDLTSAEVTLYAIRPDGETVFITGTVENGYAIASLTSECYAFTGKLKCTMVVSVNGVTLSGVRIWLMVGEASTDIIVDPGEAIPSIQELLAEIETMRSATAAAQTATSQANTAAGQASGAASTASSAASQATSAAGTANTAADNANAAAGKIDGLTVAASSLAAGASPTATVSEVDGHKHIAFGIPKGDTGAAAGFGTPTASVDAGIGTPSVEVQTSGSNTAKVFKFIFHNLKGEKGDAGDGTVNTVNGQSPDSSGNVLLKAAHIATDIATAGYTHVKEAIQSLYTAVTTAFSGASSSAAGSMGMVPAPAAGKQAQFLRGDGTWQTPTNTKNTAGSTDSSSKLFLIGATSQAASPQTYSHDTAYVGTDGCLYSGGKKVLTDHQDISGKVPTTRKINGKALSADVTLNDEDIPSTAVSGATTVEGALGSLSTDITTLDGRVDNSIIAGSTHTLSVGGTISQQTISCPGMTANHRVGNWGLSTGSIQNPPADIEIVEGTDEYTLTVSNVTVDFNFTPIFILPQN